MKKYIIFTVLTAIFIASFAFSIYASDDCGVYNWYCMRNSEHKQPTLESNMNFIENYNAYFADKNHGDASEDKVIYLTFDAGYENGNIAKILDVLDAQNVKGAFFVLDNLIKRDTELVKRMVESGHTVCNHTKNHKDMTKLSKEEFCAELKGLEEVYTEYTGAELSKYYRPPEGRFNEQSLKYANELGYKTIFWSFAYADWDNNKQMSPEKAKEKILSNVHNGEVMLLHPTSATNAAILDSVISELKNQGYRFGTLDELTGECK